jgi:uncharacterized protein YqeY
MEEELKAARLARDADRRDALSLILNALRNAEKELERQLSDDEELQVLQRERKRRVEAADAFRSGGREEQAEDEEYELEVLEEFMPEPLSEEELEEIIDDVISEVGATSIRDLGRVMAGVMHKVSGRADGSTVNQLVKEKASHASLLRPRPTLRPCNRCWMSRTRSRPSSRVSRTACSMRSGSASGARSRCAGTV